MVGFYLIDNSTFTELFCVNQDKPELKCNGKCELSKLNKEKSSPEKPSHLDFLHREVLLFLSPLEKTSFFTFSEVKKHPLFYLNSYTYQFSKSITHPPSKA